MRGKGFICGLLLLPLALLSANPSGVISYAWIDREGRAYHFISGTRKVVREVPAATGSSLNNHQLLLPNRDHAIFISGGKIFVINNRTLEVVEHKGSEAVTGIFLGKDTSKFYFVDSGRIYSVQLGSLTQDYVCDLPTSFRIDGASARYFSYALDEVSMDLYISSKYGPLGKSTVSSVYRWNLLSGELEKISEGRNVEIVRSSSGPTVISFCDDEGLYTMRTEGSRSKKRLVRGDVYKYRIVSENSAIYSVVTSDNFKGAGVIEGFAYVTDGKSTMVEKHIVADDAIIE